MRTPKTNSDHEAAEAPGGRKDEIAANQDGDSRHQDRPGTHPVAQCSRRVGERDKSEIEDGERQRRHRFAQPDLDSLEDQESFGEAGEGEQEADSEESLGILVEISEALEERRVPGAGLVSLRFA